MVSKKERVNSQLYVPSPHVRGKEERFGGSSLAIECKSANNDT
jgi:hypothetical protein